MWDLVAAIAVAGVLSILGTIAWLDARRLEDDR
jgi:hypothetical protein